MGKIAKTSFNVDEETWEKFKKFVKLKYGKVKGVLSMELKAAIEEYLDNHRDEIKFKGKLEEKTDIKKELKRKILEIMEI